LKSTVKAAWTSLGVKEITDVNCGNQIGIAEEVENRTYGKRTMAVAAYPLDEVTVMSETFIRRVILLSEKVATGVEIAGGRTFAAKREVVVDPQLLMLSGMG
jgi:hypothetical protein